MLQLIILMACNNNTLFVVVRCVYIELGQNVQNPFSSGAPPRTPLWELTTLPRPSSRLGGDTPNPPLDAFGASNSMSNFYCRFMITLVVMRHFIWGSERFFPITELRGLLHHALGTLFCHQFCCVVVIESTRHVVLLSLSCQLDTKRYRCVFRSAAHLGRQLLLCSLLQGELLVAMTQRNPAFYSYSSLSWILCASLPVEGSLVNWRNFRSSVLRLWQPPASNRSWNRVSKVNAVWWTVFDFLL